MSINGAYHFYLNDHLGTPQQLAAKNGAKSWEAIYEAFGKATVTTSTVTNNLRFPGQYADAETGYHYNFHRSYDNSTGRYIKVDPIGRSGGMNTYEYTIGNPLKNIDVLGLSPDIAGCFYKYSDVDILGCLADNDPVMQTVKANAQEFWGCYGCQVNCVADFIMPGMKELAMTTAKYRAAELADKFAKQAALGVLKRFNGVLTAVDAGLAVKCYYNCSKKKNCCELK